MFGVLHAVGLAAYRIGVHLAALVRHPKARKSVTGRRVGRTGSPEPPGVPAPIDRERIHLHCASFGEFEQGAPVLAALRERGRSAPSC